MPFCPLSSPSHPSPQASYPGLPRMATQNPICTVFRFPLPTPTRQLTVSSLKAGSGSWVNQHGSMEERHWWCAWIHEPVRQWGMSGWKCCWHRREPRIPEAMKAEKTGCRPRMNLGGSTLSIAPHGTPSLPFLNPVKPRAAPFHHREHYQRMHVLCMETA